MVVLYDNFGAKLQSLVDAAATWRVGDHSPLAARAATSLKTAPKALQLKQRPPCNKWPIRLDQISGSSGPAGGDVRRLANIIFIAQATCFAEQVAPRANPREIPSSEQTSPGSSLSLALIGRANKWLIRP